MLANAGKREQPIAVAEYRHALTAGDDQPGPPVGDRGGITDRQPATGGRGGLDVPGALAPAGRELHTGQGQRRCEQHRPSAGAGVVLQRAERHVQHDQPVGAVDREVQALPHRGAPLRQPEVMAGGRHQEQDQQRRQAKPFERELAEAARARIADQQADQRIEGPEAVELQQREAGVGRRQQEHGHAQVPAVVEQRQPAIVQPGEGPDGQDRGQQQEGAHRQAADQQGFRGGFGMAQGTRTDEQHEVQADRGQQPQVEAALVGIPGDGAIAEAHGVRDSARVRGQVVGRERARVAQAVDPQALKSGRQLAGQLEIGRDAEQVRISGQSLGCLGSTDRGAVDQHLRGPRAGRRAEGQPTGPPAAPKGRRRRAALEPRRPRPVRGGQPRDVLEQPFPTGPRPPGQGHPGQPEQRPQGQPDGTPAAQAADQRGFPAARARLWAEASPVRAASARASRATGPRSGAGAATADRGVPQRPQDRPGRSPGSRTNRRPDLRPTREARSRLSAFRRARAARIRAG